MKNYLVGVYRGNASLKITLSNASTRNEGKGEGKFIHDGT